MTHGQLSVEIVTLIKKGFEDNLLVILKFSLSRYTYFLNRLLIVMYNKESLYCFKSTVPFYSRIPYDRAFKADKSIWKFLTCDFDSTLKSRLAWFQNSLSSGLSHLGRNDVPSASRHVAGRWACRPASRNRCLPYVRNKGVKHRVYVKSWLQP